MHIFNFDCFLQVLQHPWLTRPPRDNYHKEMLDQVVPFEVSNLNTRTLTSDKLRNNSLNYGSSRSASNLSRGMPRPSLNTAAAMAAVYI